jgi:nucleoside-diphosphate-sugar epimerase
MGSAFLPRMRTLDTAPDVIVHFAAVVNTDKCEHNPTVCVDVNVEGTRRVLEACKEFKCKMLYISTTATYDPDKTIQRPYTEQSPQNPGTIYGITKYAGELLVRNQNVVPWVVIRPCFIVGNPPFDHSSQLCRVAMHGAIKQYWSERASVEMPRVTLNPEFYKDYMAEEDFSAALVLVLKRWELAEKNIFNVSNMRPRPMGEYFKLLSDYTERLGYAVEMQWVPEADYMRDHLVDSHRLRSVLGWEPKTSIETKIGMLALNAQAEVIKARANLEELFYV